MCQKFNKTLVFYNFFRNALEILGLKSWDLKTFCVFTVDVASVGRFPICPEPNYARRMVHPLVASLAQGAGCKKKMTLQF